MSAPIKLPPCPNCGAPLHLETRLKPVDPPASLAGATPKLAVTPWPYLVCTHCKFIEAGKFDVA